MTRATALTGRDRNMMLFGASCGLFAGQWVGLVPVSIPLCLYAALATGLVALSTVKL